MFLIEGLSGPLKGDSSEDDFHTCAQGENSHSEIETANIVASQLRGYDRPCSEHSGIGVFFVGLVAVRQTNYGKPDDHGPFDRSDHQDHDHTNDKPSNHNNLDHDYDSTNNDDHGPSDRSDDYAYNDDYGPFDRYANDRSRISARPDL